MPNAKETGNIGEEIAAKYLVKNGYIIIERNYRKRHGEIDIIAEKEELLVFVEVKYRTTNQLGLGTAAINKYKKQKIMNTARSYIFENDISPHRPVSFDVIEIYEKEISHFENAFWA